LLSLGLLSLGLVPFPVALPVQSLSGQPWLKIRRFKYSVFSHILKHSNASLAAVSIVILLTLHINKLEAYSDN